MFDVPQKRAGTRQWAFEGREEAFVWEGYNGNHPFCPGTYKNDI